MIDRIRTKTSLRMLRRNRLFKVGFKGQSHIFWTWHIFNPKKPRKTLGVSLGHLSIFF